MTKMVRIESLDDAAFNVVAQTWGPREEDGPDRLISEVKIPNKDGVNLTIHAQQYLVIKEG